MTLLPVAALRNRPAKTYYTTRSMCPQCGELVPGAVVARDGRVLVTRSCPQHGAFDGVICSDVAWYESLDRFDVEPVRPRGVVRPAALGCPEDCGLCTAHRQIAGTLAIEISNHCNANCPTCLARNQRSFELGPDDVREAIEAVLRGQDYIDTVTLSGGEPTVHPRLFEILAVLRRPEIGRLVINSNGVRIAQDDAFVAALAAQGDVYVCLHFDGRESRRLRGTPPELQERALERLIAHGVPVAPLVLAAQGVNDHELGELVPRLLLRSPAVRSVMLSMMTYAGEGGSSFPGDPLSRLTIPAAIDRIADGTGKAIGRRAFMPLPMPNPLCAAVGYFLVMDGELTPLLAIADLDRVVAYARNSNIGKIDAGLEALLRDTIDDIFANPDAYPDGERLLGRFRRLLDELFPTDRKLDDTERRRLAEQSLKTVYLVQFMDAWSFDARRLEKCSCQHALPGGKVIPSCGYYTYHRRFDPRFSEIAGPAR